jgi:hypothetical protein
MDPQQWFWFWFGLHNTAWSGQVERLVAGTERPWLLTTASDTSAIGYRDFNNLMGFTSKKLLNNILKNFCQKRFSIG